MSNIKLTNLHPSTSKIDRVLSMSQAPFFFFSYNKERTFSCVTFPAFHSFFQRGMVLLLVRADNSSAYGSALINAEDKKAS